MPPVEFVLFGLTLLGIALLHRHALMLALGGLVLAALYRVVLSDDPGLPALAEHFAHESVILANLMLLLLGFAALSNQFERSNLPEAMPSWLPAGWQGGLALLALVFVLSIFLDNIAGA